MLCRFIYTRTCSSDGVVNQASVLVSVADAYATKPLLHTQLELEARVGIGLAHRVLAC